MPIKDSYKKLHSDWKKAKKDAERTYDFWQRMFTDVTRAHEDVKFSTPRFPKFKLDLGPSLDKLEAEKDVEKYHAKAVKAVKQYTTDIKELKKAINKMPEPKDTQGKKIHNLLLQEADDLLTVIQRIESKLSE